MIVQSNHVDAPFTTHIPPSFSHTNRAHAPSCVPFPDVQLGRLLGSGSQGRVYSARMAGMPVAAKVVLHTVVDKHASAAAAARQRSGLEAIIGMRLSHPHIVRHIDYAVVGTSVRDLLIHRCMGVDSMLPAPSMR